MSISPLLAYLIVKSGEYDKLKEFVEKAEKFKTGDVTTLEMISKEESQMFGGMMRASGSRRPDTPRSGQRPSEREKIRQSELKAVAEAAEAAERDAKEGKGGKGGKKAVVAATEGTPAAETSEGTPEGTPAAETPEGTPAAEAKGKGKAGEVVEPKTAAADVKAVEAAEAAEAAEAKKEADAKEGKGGQGAKTLVQTQLLQQIKDKLTADEVMELFVLILKMIEK